MPSAYIVRRNNVKSTTYQVKYRLGGRSARIRHAGTFKTLREARARANWVRGEIAAMREPNLSFSSAQLDGITCGQAIQQMIDGRVDVSPNTLRSWSNCIPVAPKLRLSEFGVEQAQAWVTALSKKYATASVMVRISALTSALDYVGLDPNPLRSNRVKLPKREPVEALPVPNQHWDLLTQQLSPNNLAMARFLELTGIRRSEAGDLKWDAVDLAAGVVLIRKGKTKTARRILRLNDWSPEAWNLLKELAAANGTTSNVFPGTPEHLSGQMARLSKKNKWPRYGPHALRHRRATLWINAGVPPREVAYRLGHQNTSTTLDTYTHRSLEAPECAEENSSS
jgi:integrase